MIKTDSIAASYATLMQQAPRTIAEYVREIRELMGNEWVDANPRAFATLVQSAAIDFHACAMAKEIARLSAAITALSERED